MTKNKVFTYFIAILLMCTAIIPLVILCLYDQPTTLDDFIVFTQVKNGYTPLSDIKIGNRYISSLWHLPWSFSESPTMTEMSHMLVVYRIYALFFIAFFCLSVFCAAKQFNTYILKLKNRYFMLFYGIVLFFLTNSIKYFSFFFYDIILSSGYTFGICLIFLFAAFLLKYHFSEKPKKRYYIILTILTFLINGTVEFYPVLIGFILFVCFISSVIKTKKPDIFIILLFFLCFFTALSYIFAPWVKGKVSAYAPGVENPYSMPRFSAWFRDTIRYFWQNLKSYFRYDTFPFIAASALMITMKMKKNGYRLRGVYLILPYAISLIMSFSLFFSGVIYVSAKTSTIMILNLILAVNVIFIFAYVFFLISRLYGMFIRKYRLHESAENICEAARAEFRSSQKYAAILFILVVLYTAFISVYRPGLPVRQAWKDVLKGTAAEYDSQVNNIYGTLLGSDAQTVTVRELSAVPQTLIVDNFWSEKKYIESSSDIDTQIAPFFNKTAIIIIP